MARTRGQPHGPAPAIDSRRLHSSRRQAGDRSGRSNSSRHARAYRRPGQVHPGHRPKPARCGRTRVKVAAYQAPLLPSGSFAALDLIRRQVRSCETQGVAILCCPEGILGGLADYAAGPGAFAIATHGDDLRTVLAPLASDTVTTIV